MASKHSSLRAKTPVRPEPKGEVKEPLGQLPPSEKILPTPKDVAGAEKTTKKSDK